MTAKKRTELQSVDAILRPDERSLSDDRALVLKPGVSRGVESGSTPSSPRTDPQAHRGQGQRALQAHSGRAKLECA